MNDLDSINHEISKFLREIIQISADKDFLWFNFRSYFRKLYNDQIILEPNMTTKKLVNRLQSLSDYKEKFGDNLLLKIFPSFKYKYHLETDLKEKSDYVNPKPPIISHYKTGRNFSLRTPEINLTRFSSPPRSKRSFPRKTLEQLREEERERTLPSSARVHTKIGDEFMSLPSTGREVLIPSNPRNTVRRPNPLSVKNDVEAVEFVSSIDNDIDENRFHFGQLDKANRYSFDVIKEPEPKSEYQTISKEGVFTITNNGQSEFLTLSEFVKSKEEYTMLKPIQLFSQFKIYKAFNYWKIKLGKSLLAKKYKKISTVSWICMKPFPPIYKKYRQIINRCFRLELFPLRIAAAHEFDNIKFDFEEAAEFQCQHVIQCSKDCLDLLNDFAFKINDKYNYESTPRSINYLADKKIPQDLLNGAPNIYKKALALTEEADEKETRRKRIEMALTHVNMLKPFFAMLDHTVIEVFLSVLRREMKNLYTYFINNPTGDHKTFRVFLTIKDGNICFSPTYQNMENLIKEHTNLLFRYFNGFIRPTRVSTKGDKMLLVEDNERQKPIRMILKEDPYFCKYYDQFIERVKKSYEEANQTLNQYKEATEAVYAFDKEWEEMKKNDQDSTRFIQNLTDLNKWNDTVKEFRMTHEYDLVSLEVHGLKNDMLQKLEKLIRENNDILFHNFTVICEKVVSDIKQYIATLYPNDDTLESLAEFNLNINNALNFIPEVKQNIFVVNSIYDKALECGELITPILEQSLANVKAAQQSFDSALEIAQMKMQNERVGAIEKLKDKQSEYEKKMGTFERQLKRQFAVIEPAMSPDIAIEDINKALDKMDELKQSVKEFELIATRLNYSDFDFSPLEKTETELKQTLQHWINYRDFMTQFNELVEEKMIEVDINKLIDFINDHNERDMRSVNHPLYDKMANSFASLAQYMPFYTLISKIEMTPERWMEICKIIKRPYELLRVQSIKKFSEPVLLDKIDGIRSYIVNLQQREDLVKHFNQMVDEFTNMAFKFVDSPIVGSTIITFPSLNDANIICENFLIYLQGLPASPFYEIVEQQCEHWLVRAKGAIAIVNSLLDFETIYVYAMATTRAIYGSLHYPCELQNMSHIKNWFSQFIAQIKEEPHINLLIPKTEERFENEINNAVIIPTEKIEEYIQSTTSVGSSSNDGSRSGKSLRSLTSFVNQTGKQAIITDDICMPLIKGEVKQFQGDFLVDCLNEARHRSNLVLSSIGDLLEEQRHTYPRLFFCSDSELISILLACKSLRSSVDDFLPIFPSISRMHVSISDNVKLIGVQNTIGEKYFFTGEIIVNRLSIPNLLEKIEIEMKKSVKARISEAASTRDYTEMSNWYMKHPLQTLLVAESHNFQASIEEILNRDFSPIDWQLFYQKQEETIEFLKQELNRNPEKSMILSLLLSLKLRHRDIAQSIFKSPNRINKNSPEINKYHHHIITQVANGELAQVKIGPQLIPYGYEIISEPSVGPMTDSEEQAIMNFACCMSDPELFFCKQENGNRFLAKTFADIIGVPCFNVDESMLNNVIVAATSLRAVLLLDECDVLPPQFHSFYKCVEEGTKIVKTNTTFNEISINNNSFLIHLSSENIPTWLQQRYRPIFLPNEPKAEIIHKLQEIKKFTLSQSNEYPIDYYSRIVLRADPQKIIHRDWDKDIIYIKNKHKLFFDLPEYLLTGQYILFEDPFPITLPENITQVFSEIDNSFSEYDATSSRAQSLDFPMRAFSRPIRIHCQNAMTAMALCYASFGEKLHHIKSSLCYLTDSMEIASFASYRTVNVEIYHDVTMESIDAIQFSDWTFKDFCSIIAQERSISRYFNEIVSYLENIYTRESIEKPDYFVINKLITKINLLRYIFKTDQSIPMSKLIECIFTDNYKEAQITQEKMNALPIETYMPILISGGISSGKRHFAKEFVQQNKQKKDIVIYSSPFNRDLQTTVFSKLKFVTRGIYAPPHGQNLWVCIFDYNNAVQEIIDFVKAFVMFKSVYSPRDDTYYHAERIHLILTSSETDEILKFRCPVFIIEAQQNAVDINWDLLESSIVFGNNKEEIQKVMMECGKPAVIMQFLKINKTLENNTDFIRTFSMYFGRESANKIANLFAVTEQNVVEYQNRNFNLATYPTDFNMASVIVEAINLHMNLILLLDNLSYFKYIKNRDFVVLDPNFHSQLFTTLIRISQNRTKTTFLIDMNYLDWNEVFDCLSFFFFFAEKPKYSTLFSPADFQIFKHYLDNESTVNKTFQELCSYINFFIICDEKNINKIPELFRNKLPVLKPDRKLNDCPRNSTNPFIDELLPLLSLDLRQFESMITTLTRSTNEHFQDFMSEVQFVVQFFANLTSLKSKLDDEFDESNAVEAATEMDMERRHEQLDLKIKDAQTKENQLFFLINQNTQKLNTITNKLNIEIPENLTKMQSILSSFNYDEQCEQINKWLSSHDDCFLLTNVYKDFFGFLTTANFSEKSQQNENHTRLIHTLLHFNVSSLEPTMVNKLLKYNLKGETPIAYLLRESNEGLNIVSQVPIINALAGVLSLIVDTISLTEERNTVSTEITNLNNRNKTNTEFLAKLKTQRDDLERVMKRKSGTTECPQWMLKAWENDQEDIRKLFQVLEKCSDILMNVIGETAEAEQLVKGYVAYIIGYNYGVCSFPIERRKELLAKSNLQIFTSSFEMLKHKIVTQILFPVKSLMNMFTQSTSMNDATQINLSMKTSQLFNTISVIDQILFNRLFPSNPLFYQEKEVEQINLLTDPLIILYDPQGIALQSLINSYKNVQTCFTSVSFVELINCISNGTNLIIQIDSVESGQEFFTFYRHIQLELNATHMLQNKDQKKPVSTAFKLFVVTTISPTLFAEYPKDLILFADFSVEKPQETDWFKYSLVFSADSQIFDEAVSQLQQLANKTISFCTILRKISELSHDSWPEYFENTQKMITLRTTLDQLIKVQNELIETTKNVNDIFLPDSESKFAIDQYSTFISLCKSVVNEMSDKNYAAFQLITAVQHFVEMRKKRQDKIDNEFLIRNFECIVIEFLNCIKPKERISFLANFEHNYLKEEINQNDLLLEGNFPNLHERQTGPLLPQLCTHICQTYSNVSQEFFSYMSKSTLPEPLENPVILMTDDILPTDYIARFIIASTTNDYKKINYYVIGGWSMQTLTAPESIENLISVCKGKNERLIIIFDEMLPDFVIPSVVYYSHFYSFVSYYIIVDKRIISEDIVTFQLIPNALYVDFARPYTMNGCTSMLSTFPINMVETQKWEGPLLFYFLLLMHRNDFQISFQQIAPTVRMCRGMFEDKNNFNDESVKNLWKMFFKQYIVSYTDDVVLLYAINNIIDYFFRGNEPNIPGIEHVDFSNDATYHAEVPPQPQNIGMMVSFGDSYESQCYNWRQKLADEPFFSISDIQRKYNTSKLSMRSDDDGLMINDEEEDSGPEPGLLIKNVHLTNGFWSHNELTLIGSSELDIYVHKQKIEEGFTENVVKAGVFDGDDFLGFISLPSSVKPDIWAMAALRLYLQKSYTT